MQPSKKNTGDRKEKEEKKQEKYEEKVRRSTRKSTKPIPFDPSPPPAEHQSLKSSSSSSIQPQQKELHNLRKSQRVRNPTIKFDPSTFIPSSTHKPPSVSSKPSRIISPETNSQKENPLLEFATMILEQIDSPQEETHSLRQPADLTANPSSPPSQPSVASPVNTPPDQPEEHHTPPPSSPYNTTPPLLYIPSPLLSNP